GQTMAFADVRAATDHDLAVIFPVAGLLFLLILAGLLRALIAPLYLVVMVVLGFAATLGATALVFQEGFGEDGLGFIIPIILYLFVTAIGTDYNILMTARLREELRAGHDRRRSALPSPSVSDAHRSGLPSLFVSPTIRSTRSSPRVSTVSLSLMQNPLHSPGCRLSGSP